MSHHPQHYPQHWYIILNIVNIILNIINIILNIVNIILNIGNIISMVILSGRLQVSLERGHA